MLTTEAHIRIEAKALLEQLRNGDLIIPEWASEHCRAAARQLVASGEIEVVRQGEESTVYRLVSTLDRIARAAK